MVWRLLFYWETTTGKYSLSTGCQRHFRVPKIFPERATKERKRNFRRMKVRGEIGMISPNGFHWSDPGQISLSLPETGKRI